MVEKVNKKLLIVTTIIFLTIHSIILPAQQDNVKYIQMYYTGMRLIGEQKYQPAKTQFKDIIEQNPSYSRAYTKLVFVYQKLDELPAAADYFQSLLTDNESNGYAYFAMGLINNLQKNYTAAQTFFLKTVELVPNYATAYKKLVDVFQKLNQLQQVEKFLKQKLNLNPNNAALQFGIAYLYQKKRDWEKAHQHYTKAIELDPSLFESYEQKGVLFYYAGKNQQFLNISLTGLKLAEEKKDEEFKSRFLANAAVAAQNLSQNSLALKYFAEALEVKKKFGNKEAQEKIYVNMGAIYRDSQKYRQALDYFDRALQMSRRLSDKNVEALCYRNIGSVYHLMGEFEQAMSYFKRAEPLIDKLDNLSVKKVLFWSMGASYYKMTDFSNSLNYSRKAYQLAVQLGDQFSQQKTVNLMGLACWNLGQYTKALDNFEAALQLARTLDDKNGQSYALGNMAIIFDVMGEFDKGLQHYESALQIAKETKNKDEQGRLLGNIGVIYHNLKKYAQAKQYYEQAIEIDKEINNKVDQATFLGNLGNLFYKSGDYQKAANYLDRSLALAKSTKNRQVEGIQLIKLGDLNFLKKDFVASRNYYQQGVEIGNRIKNPKLLWESNAGLGNVYRDQGQFQKSLQHYKFAINEIEKVRSTLGVEEFKTGFLENKTQVYENIIGVLAEQHRKNPGKHFAEQGFFYSEKARARAFLDLLAESRANITSRISPQLKARERKILRQIASTQTKLRQPEINDDQWKQLSAQLQKQEEEIRKLKRDMRKTNPNYANLVYPQPYRLNQVRKRIIDENGALLEFSLGDSSSFVWVVTESATKLYQLPGREQIEKTVRDYLKTISRPFSLTNPLAKHRALGYKLYQKLMGNFASDLQGKTSLIIIPEGILFYLPMETLIPEQTTSSDPIRYLINDYTISYAPSASVLCFLKENKSIHPAERKALLAFGDPYFGDSDVMAVRGDEFPADTMKHEFEDVEIRADVLTRGLYEQRGFKFKRLPFSGTEVSEISSSFPVSQSRVYLGENAKEEVVKSIDLANYQYLHFATHGIIDQEIPSRSGIVFTLDDDPKEDGFLQMNEILNLKLNADLVTLSACQTGLGKLQRGEGMVGLTRAFIYAGTPAVVVSLWNINDRSTAKFMKYFYQFLKDGKRPAAALQLAKKMMLLSQRKSYHHPYYWAPYVIVGESR